MSTLDNLTSSADAVNLKTQYKSGLICAYEVALALVNQCTFEGNPDVVSFDDLFETLQVWVKA